MDRFLTSFSGLLVAVGVQAVGPFDFLAPKLGNREVP